MHGGDRIAEVLECHGVASLFTLCGGHISPILVGCKRRGIRVVDVRHEASAVFAADATARLTGVPGVAAVTAGPGATNTITAVKNAQMAQSPVVVLVGATATILKGRGALQDIDQAALFAPHVKWMSRVQRVRDLAPAVDRAFYEASLGVPGPVVVECPVDLLYSREVVAELYGAKAGKGRQSLSRRALGLFLRFHVGRLFAGANRPSRGLRNSVPKPELPRGALARSRRLLARAEKPLLLIGSQATLNVADASGLASAVEKMGIPVYLSGMARGLLGKGHELHLRHKRRNAIREADLVLLAGVACDFRLEYGQQIPRRAKVISVNLDAETLTKNRQPTQAIVADPGFYLRELAGALAKRINGDAWLDSLRSRDRERDEEIARLATEDVEGVNPLDLCRRIDEVLEDHSVLVADGGDFVGTASYSLSPRGPLAWLDPGPFGTLGVGGGFAIGAKLARPDAEVWILYGDGSAAYSLAEFDTCVRLGIPIIAVVGNDASWAQIARDQVRVLGDDVGTVLRRTDYHRVAEGYGGLGIVVERPDQVPAALREAKEAAGQGRPVLINVHIGKTDFRKGSISL